MAITLTQQYRPLTSVETSEMDGLSSRFYRDLIRNDNNLKARVCNAKVVSQFWRVEMNMDGAAGVETWAASYIVPVVDGYTTFTWVFRAYRSAVTGTTTARLYSYDRPYTGSPTGNENSASIVISGTAKTYYPSTATPLTVRRGKYIEGVGEITHLTLTGQNSDANRANATCLAVWFTPPT